MSILLSITCLCGSVAQTLAARPPPGHGDGPIPLSICHCDTCRHTSGVFFTSYCPIQSIEVPVAGDGVLSSLTSYTSSPGTTRYFCKTCGCHVFRARQSGLAGERLWDVATGTIVNEWADGHESSQPAPPLLEYVQHEHVADTADGGLSGWLRLPLASAARAGDDNRLDTETDSPDSPGTNRDPTFTAACHCGAIELHVRPPDHDIVASRKPHSGFADLLVPFAASDPALVVNPDDVKWWLRPEKPSLGGDTLVPPTRYLAGMCACQSCRLATGFEVQTWAFVPRINIRLPDGNPIDFSSTGNPYTLYLSTYHSSPGVDRNFCSRCGASVFWHNTTRPDLIDVSAGLFRSASGSRLKQLLDWCTSRVSFSEEATRGRQRLSAQRAATLIADLGIGMEGHS